MNKKAFTLVEIIIGILIASMIIIIGFQALNSVMIAKIKLIESTNIEKETFRFSQKFFEEIKRGGTIDYEEYFNRMAVNSGVTDLYLSGHYKRETYFGNSGSVNDGFYYCRSKNSSQMGTGGCLSDFNSLVDGTNGNKDYTGEPQRYGEYSLQFIDYNSNYDDDKGDEDSNGIIIGDDDDEYLGAGPKLFKAGSGVTELYLISADRRRRTFFRWTINVDSQKPSNATCTTSDNGKTYTGSGCLGTVEFLKLDGKDFGISHNGIKGFGDGVVDTWLVNKDFIEDAGDSYSENYANLIMSGDKYWMKLFPNSINVKSFEIQAYPNADIKQSWKVKDIDLAPYIRIKMTLTPSWKIKKQIKGKVPEFNISTTINLTDIFSKY